MLLVRSQDRLLVLLVGLQPGFAGWNLLFERLQRAVAEGPVVSRIKALLEELIGVGLGVVSSGRILGVGGSQRG